VREGIKSVRTELLERTHVLCETLLSNVKELHDALRLCIGATRIDVLRKLVGGTHAFVTAADLRAEVQALRSQIMAALDEYISRASATRSPFSEVLTRPEIPDTALRLLRAFGEPPRVPNLDFQLPGIKGAVRGIGYYFREAMPEVETTRILGLPD